MVILRQRVLSESRTATLTAVKSAWTCDAGFLLSVILALAGCRGMGVAKKWCFTVMVSQIGVFILKVGRALPSRLAMPSLLQGSHSQTGTHVVHGERMRRRIAGSSPFFLSLL